MRTITLNRNDYQFYGGNTTILVRIGATDTDQHMDAENKIPNWIMKRCGGHYGYSDNKGNEFKVIFVCEKLEKIRKENDFLDSLKCKCSKCMVNLDNDEYNYNLQTTLEYKYWLCDNCKYDSDEN